MDLKTPNPNIDPLSRSKLSLPASINLYLV